MKMTAHKAKINKIMHYTNDKAIGIDTFNMSALYNEPLKNKIEEMEELQKKYNYSSRKYYHLILSPEENDFDKEKLLNYARELLQEKFPLCQGTISIHNDKKNKLDCHIILNATQIDNKKIDIKNNEYDKIKTYAQETLAKKYGYQTITKEQRKYNHKRKTQTEYGLEKKGVMPESQRIKRVIRDTLKFNDVINIDTFKKELKKQGIVFIENENKTYYKTKALKYKLSDSKLGKQYLISNIKNILESKKEIVKTKAPETINKNLLKEFKELLNENQAYIPEKQIIKIRQIFKSNNLTNAGIKGLIAMIKEIVKSMEIRENERTR